MNSLNLARTAPRLAQRASVLARPLLSCTCPAAPRFQRSFASTSRASRTADQFVNMISADAARPMVSISSLTPTAGFTLSDGLVVPAPIIIIDGTVFLWDVGAPNEQDMSWEGWSEEKLKLFEMVVPRPEILLVGTGPRGLFPPPAFKKHLNSLGIQVDVLDSRNASSTYNLLAEEGRRVAAALYPLTNLSARTGQVAGSPRSHNVKLEASTYRALSDKVYEKRKNAALDLERVVREASAADDVKKLHNIIAQLCDLAGNPQSNSRSGAIMGLAGAAIALGPRIAEHLGALVPPVLGCFTDTDSKVRYFACESMYNIAKVAKGEILIFFNELFDAMSKLAADTELPVKNGAELLDRLIKDIVTEQASTYVSANAVAAPMSPQASTSVNSPDPANAEHEKQPPPPERAFSLARFIPLLRERIYVLNPFTRTYLVSWLTVLDSVPELELVSFLPEFLDGLLKFLGDPTVDIRTATQNVLADFLREIREVAEVQKSREEDWRTREDERDEVGSKANSRRASQISAGETMTDGERIEEESEEGETAILEEEEPPLSDGDDDYEEDLEGSGEWVPGQGVHVDHAAIVEILLEHLSFPDEEIQSTCLRWIAEFLLFVQPTMVPFAPRLIPVILSSLAHHVATIRTAANDTNYNLFAVIQALPVPASPPSTPHPTHLAPPGSSVVQQGKQSEGPKGEVIRDRNLTASPPPTSIPFPSARLPSLDRATAAAGSAEGSISPITSRLESSLGLTEIPDGERSRSSLSDGYGALGEADPFDYGATVNALTLQFLNEHEETRVAALEWLLMLHQKAPKKILAVDDPSGDATRNSSRIRHAYDGSESGLSIALLLKMLSDQSERVLRYDLQLLAQISSSSEEEYFPSFMMSLLSLFSTDRRLLETRGSLIIRQLCSSLNTERIYRTFAEILERDEDLEFASIMVQNLNLIMITSPELSEFRKRLKTLESKDGQALFTILYRSWSHNAVATFSLCLLAQAYEQACALLQIFADLEITVGLLIQIDKLVQLLESPVFTSLRLQLLEPERYPYLLKAMYGLLMLLPQSSAFATLRNRLSAVSSLGFLQTVPRHYTSTSSLPGAPSARSNIVGSGSGPSTTATGRRGVDGEGIRWTELLTHFRVVQKRRASATAHIGGEAAMETVGAGGQMTAPPVVAGGAGAGGGQRGVSGSSALATGGTGAGQARRKLAPGLGGRMDSGSTIRVGSGSQGGANGWKASGSAGGGSSATGAAAARPSSPIVVPKRRAGGASVGSAPGRKP